MESKLNLEKINKLLSQKDIDPTMKKSLLQKKDILLKNKTVKK